MTPAIMTETELRAWLRNLGYRAVRLNRALDRTQYFDVPGIGGGCWAVTPLITGAFTVTPSNQREQ